ncbi:MAG: glycyl-radical enzyme activating protein [Chloroflexi bacterium]|nr:glycyl-radical enzyme activating protein [Chloroflexota bacterium]
MGAESKGSYIEKALIFNIQRYSLQDGPGIRTTVFLKGCPLRCIWCSNPESQNSYPEVAHSNSLCTKCGACMEVCSAQALRLNNKGIQIDRELCNNCAKCVEACVPKALKVLGRWLSINEVLGEVVRDELYYRNSGGGVTVSGGEPLMQAAFVLSLLRSCKRRGVHTVLDTAGYASPDILKDVLKYVDLVLFDIKIMKPTEHRKLTGVWEQLILDNARAIVAEGTPLIIRVPLIPGVNDSGENIRAIGSFAASLKDGIEVNLLPYHRFGMSKYDSLDREYDLRSLPSLTAAECETPREIIQSFGLKCEVVV